MCIKSWDIKGILRQKDSGEIDAFASLFVLRMVHHTHVWKMAGGEDMLKALRPALCQTEEAGC